MEMDSCCSAEHPRVFIQPARRLFVCFPNKHLLRPRQAAGCRGPSHEQGQPRMRTRSPEKQTDAQQVITNVMDATEEEQRELQERTGGGHQCPICARFYSPPASKAPPTPRACLRPPGLQTSLPGRDAPS